MKYGGALVKLIIFTVITLILTGVLTQTIGNISFASQSTYKARFTDVTGLFGTNDVKIAGVKVGSVKSAKVVDKKYAELTFTVRKDIRLRKSTQAQIKYLNLVGGRFLALTEGPGDPALLPRGGTIALANTKPALDLTVLFNGFKPLFQALNPQDVNKLAYEIVQTLQGEGPTFNDLLARTASLTNTIADKDAVIGRVIDNLTTVLGTVDARDNGLDQLIAQLGRLFSGLSQDRQAIGDSLVNINQLAGDFSGFLQDTRPALKPDIQNLGSVAVQLNTDKGALAKQVQNLAQTLNSLTRTAHYGSFFNFYLCKIGGNFTITPPGLPTQTISASPPPSTSSVCNN